MNRACTFIGHHDCPENIIPELRKQIEKMILSGIDTFYIGTHGNFDFYVYQQLENFEKVYEIKFIVVLATLDKLKGYISPKKTIYPTEVANTVRKFCIVKRNYYMIKNSTHLVCYINNTFSNAYQFYEFAKKKNLEIINLGKL